ncbi:hypothetical protein ACN47E_003624 [Coniothyrium glycines]
MFVSRSFYSFEESQSILCLLRGLNLPTIDIEISKLIRFLTNGYYPLERTSRAPEHLFHPTIREVIQVHLLPQRTLAAVPAIVTLL